MAEVTARDAFIDPIFNNNPLALQILGICSSLAVTTKMSTALVMAVAVTVVTDREVLEAAAGLAGAYAAVPDDAWERPGIRSNVSLFTVATLGQYGLHDLRHHLWDVGVDSS